MKREIKFRVFDQKDKRMITHKQDFIPLLISSVGVLRLSPHHENDLYELLNGDRFEIMQYTGLKDKHGVEIYEGDIVDNGTGNYKGVITFANGCFLHRNSPLGYFVEDGVIEDNRTDPDGHITLQEGAPELWAAVVGNIYQNPELL